MSQWNLLTAPSRPHDERHHYGDPERFQKERLAQRKGGHSRPEIRDDPVQPDPGTVGFLEERLRFSTDAASEERAKRMKEISNREAFYQARRTVRIGREEKRWAAVDEAFEKEKQRGFALQQSPAAKTNKNSVPYNPITHQFHDSLDSLRQRFVDESVRYRANLRKLNLYQKSTSTSYDPITGRELETKFAVPLKPELPQALASSQCNNQN